MKRMLLFLAVAFAMSGTWTAAQAQSVGVQISKFHGTVRPDNTVQLGWWANESSSFIIHIVEHSVDRVNFQPIGEVPALLTGESSHFYSFIHTTPSPRLNFYRLNLVYDHGMNTYSETIRAYVGGAGIAPRPANPNFGATARPLSGEVEDQWNEAIISDMYGRPILRMVAGQNELDIEGLPTGIYIVNARYSDGWQTSKFVINKN